VPQESKSCRFADWNQFARWKPYYTCSALYRGLFGGTLTDLCLFRREATQEYSSAHSALAPEPVTFQPSFEKCDSRNGRFRLFISLGVFGILFLGGPWEDALRRFHNWGRLIHFLYYTVTYVPIGLCDLRSFPQTP